MNKQTRRQTTAHEEISSLSQSDEKHFTPLTQLTLETFQTKQTQMHSKNFFVSSMSFNGESNGTGMTPGILGLSLQSRPTTPIKLDVEQFHQGNSDEEGERVSNEPSQSTTSPPSIGTFSPPSIGAFSSHQFFKKDLRNSGVGESSQKSLNAAL